MRQPGIALVVLALAGCTLGRDPQPAPPPAAAAPPSIEQRSQTIENGFLSFTVEIPREPAGPKPLVVALGPDLGALHDAGWATVQFKFHWELLQGLAPATPPAAIAAPPKNEPTAQLGAPAAPSPVAPPAPGKTWGKWLLASPAPETVGQGYFGLIEMEAAYAIPKVLDALAADPDIDARRIGIAGNSTGGFVALQAVAKDRRIGAAAVVVATGDYPCFLERSSLAMDGEPLRLDPAYRRFLLARDPAVHPRRLRHAAVLMVNGRTDPAMPLPCVEATIARLRASYARAGASERFRAVILDGGHNIGQDANLEVMAWLHRWLDPRPRASSRAAP